jgi:hypothetical protein
MGAIYLEGYANNLNSRFVIGNTVYTHAEIEYFAVVHGFNIVEAEEEGKLTVNIGDDAEDLVWQFKAVPGFENDPTDYYELEYIELDLLPDAAEYYRGNIRASNNASC